MFGPDPVIGVQIVGDVDGLTAVAVDHVLLGYDYLCRDDPDGCLSLVEHDVLTCVPPGQVHRGRAALDGELGRTLLPVRPERVIVVRPLVLAVTGRLFGSGNRGPVAPDSVVDLIVASGLGLIESWFRTCPGPPAPAC